MRTPELLGPEGETLWALAALPNPVPKGWRVDEEALDGASYRSATGIFAILSGSTERDGRRWLHLSLSRKDRIPDWNDVRATKEALLGDRYAVMVFPPRRLYVNIARNALHLFSPADAGDYPLPEFSLGGLTL